MSVLFISGGVVIDPETMQSRLADVRCVDGTIDAIVPHGRLAPDGAQIIDASGCFVCPGFIDPHGHIDGCRATGVLSLLQGITTSIGGNCGFSPLAVGEFLRGQNAFPIHQAELVGLCALREAAGATEPFSPTTDERVRRMEVLCEQALREGAAGVSLGPGYAPGATLEEMEALCRLAHAYGRPVAIDTRMYSMTDLNSLQEAIELAEVTGCRMIVSHFEYQYGVGVEYKALEMLELARERGVDMHLDSGMYKDWCSSIGSALFEPVTMRDNGIELDHLRVITGEHIGCLPDQALYEHLRQAHPGDAVVVATGSEEAVYTIQRYPLTMVSTDTGSYAAGEGHPQIAGSFPRLCARWWWSAASSHGSRPCTTSRCCPPARSACPQRGASARALTRTSWSLTPTPSATAPRSPASAARTPRPRASAASSSPARSPRGTACSPARWPDGRWARLKQYGG